MSRPRITSFRAGAGADILPNSSSGRPGGGALIDVKMTRRALNPEKSHRRAGLRVTDFRAPVPSLPGDSRTQGRTGSSSPSYCYWWWPLFLSTQCARHRGI